MSEPRERTPHLVVIGGPNGAGKSTIAPLVLQGELGVTEFVNADVIAQGLSAFRPDREAIQAGRIMLARLKELAAARDDFAFETTLASRSFAPWIRGLRENGYDFHLVFVWLADAETAVNRVAARVRSGGHQVPADTIRRRYHRGVFNFFELYRSLASSWMVYNNSHPVGPGLVASGSKDAGLLIHDFATWQAVNRSYDDAKRSRDTDRE